MNVDTDSLIEKYQARLPGIVRATLLDYGISERVIATRQIGWDGRSITVPVRERRGGLAFFERWDERLGIGRPAENERLVELYPWQALQEVPRRMVLAEGIHEALVFESHGFPAVAATGSGLFFKTREWAAVLKQIPEVLIAFRSGERRPRQAFRLGRSEVVAEAQRALPSARVVTWPAVVGWDRGAFEFFVKLKHSAADFENLTQHR